MYACQIQKVGGEKLPRLVFDVELLHDAQREYCERHNIDHRDVSLSRSQWNDYFWIEACETYNEEPDVTIF